MACRGCFFTAFSPTHFPLPHLGVCFHDSHGYCDTITLLCVLHHQLLLLVLNFCFHDARNRRFFHLIAEKPNRMFHVPISQPLLPSNHYLLIWHNKTRIINWLDVFLARLSYSLFHNHICIHTLCVVCGCDCGAILLLHTHSYATSNLTHSCRCMHRYMILTKVVSTDKMDTLVGTQFCVQPTSIAILTRIELTTGLCVASCRQCDVLTHGLGKQVV